MTEETKAAAVYAAISKVMGIIAKEGIQKDRKNEQQGFKYRGIDDVYNALAPAFVEAGLIVIPECLSRDLVERESKSGAALFYVTVQATYTMIAVSDGSSVKAGPFYGEAMDSGDKATNKAMSGAYKYWAMQTFAIPTNAENDADNTGHQVRPNSATQVAKDALAAMSPEEQDFLRTHAERIKALFPLGDMIGYINEQRFDTEEKLAIWSLLPSDVRSAIKKQQAEESQANTAKLLRGELASQP